MDENLNTSLYLINIFYYPASHVKAYSGWVVFFNEYKHINPILYFENS